MGHVFLNLFITKLRNEVPFKHAAFIGNRHLIGLTKSYFTHITHPIFKDTSGLSVYKCTFKKGVSNVINIVQNPWEYSERRNDEKE